MIDVLKKVILNLNIFTKIVLIIFGIAYFLSPIDIIPDFIPEEHIFENFDDCTSWIKEHVKDTI